MVKKLLIVFAVALFLRLLVIPNPGFEADISFWKSWGLATADFGAIEGLKVANNNYPTPFVYLLGALVTIYRLFADPHNFNEFWSNTNVLFLAVAKMPSIISDFGIAAILFFILRSPKRFGFPELPKTNYHLPVLIPALYLLNPIAILDGAWWGQVDSVGVFIFLLAVVAALKKHPFLAGLLYMVAMMTKLQNLIYGPVFFIFLWQYLGFTGLVRGVAGALSAFVGLNIEFILAKYFDRVVTSLTENYDYFPYMSLNAYNLWWIVSGGEGMEMSDKMLTLGIANAKSVGLAIFSSLYLAATLHLFAKGNLIKRFFESLIIVAGAFFLFQTQSHDRYAFPIIAFLLFLVPFYVMKVANHGITKPLIWFSSIYTIFSGIYFYNLHTALIINYPHNGLPILTQMTQKPLTITVSFVLIGFYLLFLYHSLKRVHPVIYCLPIALCIGLIVQKNLPLILDKPVSLTKLTPFISSQEYGQRVINMPIGAAGASKNWTPLSVQYAFYRHGIGTHARSQNTFDLNHKFTRLTFDYGIDTEAGSQASAVFEVWGDEKMLFQSDPIKRFELPRHADVDITNVKTLHLITTGTDDGINDDHTDWLNPVLYP